MERDTIRFLITSTIFSLALFGAAVLLTGCERINRFAEYCLRDTRNCD